MWLFNKVLINKLLLYCCCLFLAEDIAKGSYDKSDSTNLYIGNINPKVNNDNTRPTCTCVHVYAVMHMYMYNCICTLCILQL